MFMYSRNDQTHRYLYIWKFFRAFQMVEGFVGKGQRGDQLYLELAVISSGNIARYYCMWGK